MTDYLKRCWTEINLDNLEHNYKKIRGFLSEKTKIMSIIKADAYGHGVKYIAERLVALGTDWLGVSNIEEALQLRRLDITLPILILGYTPPEYAATLAGNNLTQTIFSTGYGRKISENALKAGVKLNIHIKTDTGMSRLGFDIKNDMRNTVAEIAGLTRLEGLDCTGIYTHFACSDNAESDFTDRQFSLFRQCTDMLGEQGINFELKHCCNSAATIAYPEYNLDMVRPGLILYGLYPCESLRQKIELLPCMELKSVVSQVKQLNKGDTVSYSRTYCCQKPTRTATVSIGYADGYQRQNSNRGFLLINGKKAPILGMVCMDQLVVDITGIENVSEGSTVTVFGRDGDEFLPVETVSGFSNSINYETVCLIGKRVPRVYIYNNRIIGYTSCIC